MFPFVGQSRNQSATFPKQVQIGPKAVGWIEAEIDAFSESCREGYGRHEEVSRLVVLKMQ